MKHPAIEYRKNPFAIDGQRPPVARSPFAILEIERDQVSKTALKAAMRRSLEDLVRDPEAAGAYGLNVSKQDLEWAHDRLSDEEGRIYAELTDHPCHEVDPGDLGALEAHLDAIVTELATEQGPRVVDGRLIAGLLSHLLGRAPSIEVDFPVPKTPDLPSASDVLNSLV